MILGMGSVTALGGLVVLLLVGLVALVIVVGLIVLTIYNSLVALRQTVKNAWAQIDVQLKRRHDLIPNLVNTVKGYAAHVVKQFERGSDHGLALELVHSRILMFDSLSSISFNTVVYHS